MQSAHLIRSFASLIALSATAHAATDPTFTLTATAQDFGHYFPTYLGNGYFATMSGARGTEGNLAYLVGLMDYGRDDVSRPAAVPGWTEIDYSTGTSKIGHFWMNQVRLDPAIFADYRQTLDMQAATLTTSYTYDDHGRKTRMETVTFVSQAAPHLAATRLSITPDFDGTVELSFALNLWAPHQPRFPMATLDGDQMQESVAAHNLDFVATPPATPDRAAVWYHGDTHVLAANGDVKDATLWLDGRAEQGLAMAEAAALQLPENLDIDATLYRSDFRLALNLNVKVQKGKTYTFDKFVAASRADWGGDGQADRALATSARAGGFDALLDTHRAAWRELWRTDIVIDGDAAAQTLAHSDLYYLLSAATPDTRWSIGACALTPGYSGHIFWDADTWIFPALLLLHPERAKSLVAFRAHTWPAAQARARAAGFAGAKYPWEADAENGTEQTPHPAHVLGEREIHINADVAIAQWQYWLATRDRDWLKRSGWPVIKNLADFWASRATWQADAKRYEIEHVTSVAESYNDVPNDTFTNASAQKVLRIAAEAAVLVGAKPDPRWAEVADKLYIPFSDSEQRHYDFDPRVPREPWEGSTLALLMYPNLDLPLPPQIRRNDFNHVMDSITLTHHEPHGMIAAPSSIAAASVGDSARAVAWMQGIFTSGLLKPPFNVRTETATNNTGYFATASGGFLQILMYGFAGLRIEDQGLVDAYAPVLPPAWKSMTLQNIGFRGHRYDITIDRGADGKPRLTRKAR
jgi:trehalose/maltose hydrolase-like predicted phosphorylase